MFLITVSSVITDSEVMALQIIWIICPGQITGCCYLDLWSDCKTVSFLLTFWNSQCNNQIPTWCNNQPTLSSFVQDGAPIQTEYISLGVCGVILILHALVSNLNPAQSVYRFFFFKNPSPVIIIARITCRFGPHSLEVIM